MYFRYTRVWGTCVVLLVRTANGFSPIKRRFCLRLNPAGVKRPQNSTGEQRRGSSAIKCVGVDGRRTDARRKSKESTARLSVCVDTNAEFPCVDAPDDWRSNNICMGTQ